MTNRLITAIAAAATLFAAPVNAEPNHGAYLAGRAAAAQFDFDEAAYWFGLALRDDPGNVFLLESALASMVGAGDVLGAASIAAAAEAAGVENQIIDMILDADAARTGDWDAYLTAHDNGRRVGPLVDGLSRAWALVGLGRMDEALPAFDEVIEGAGLRPFGLYHKALALASVGDHEGAASILTLTPQDGMPVTRRGLIALSQVLSQLGRNDEAVALLDQVFGPDPDLTLTTLRSRLAAGEQVPFDIVSNATEGVAEIYFTVAGVLGQDTPSSFTLIYARLAQALNPSDPEMSILAAELLTELGNLELAAAAYGQVAAGEPAFYEAEIGRAEAIRKSGDLALTTEILRNLVRSHPDRPLGHLSLANVLRRQSLFAPAEAAYTAALDRLSADDPRRWFALYMRGISHHNTDDWPAAEADFRAALALNPGQPQVLNYLGYTMVERRENLDEALAMIEQAIAAQPDNGAIVDSLGWALFVLGRTDESIAPLERAAELEAVDPIVNDHLGDAYWTVGRHLEAQFQWNRALSFDPEPDLAERIRRKLEVGLDEVLREEADSGAISVAQDP